MSQTTGQILQQNTGKQAAVIGEIIQAQGECGGSLFRLRQTAPDLWKSLIAEVDQTVRVMPLWKLQTVAAEAVAQAERRVSVRDHHAAASTPRDDDDQQSPLGG